MGGPELPLSLAVSLLEGREPKAGVLAVWKAGSGVGWLAVCKAGSRRLVCSLQGRQGAAQNPPAILALFLGKIGVDWLAGTEVAQIAPILCLGCPGTEMVQRAPHVMIFGPLCVAWHEDSESGLQMGPLVCESQEVVPVGCMAGGILAGVACWW